MESNVQIEVSGDIPVDYIPATTKRVVDMTEEEREEFFKHSPALYERYLENKKSGYYNRCLKTDFCKLERENKEKQEKEKDELIKAQNDKIEALQNVVIQQNQVLAQIIDKINKNI